MTLVPLLVAIVVTLEICVVIGLQLNFANIIALPLLLGVGVAFKIYYIMAWRSGERKLSAIEFDAGLSSTAPVPPRPLSGAVVLAPPWYVEHGKPMALCLVTTLAAAVLFQPALLATQNKASGSK